MAPRAHEQLALLMLLVGDQDPEIASAAETTIDMIPRASLRAFLARSDAPPQLRECFARRGVEPADTPAPQADAPLLEVVRDDDALLNQDPAADEEEVPEGSVRESTVPQVAALNVAQRMALAMKGTRE